MKRGVVKYSSTVGDYSTYIHPTGTRSTGTQHVQVATCKDVVRNYMG